MTHPLFQKATGIRVHSTESRSFVHVRGAASHLAELVWNPKVPNAIPSLRVMEELEGLEVGVIVTGAANRLGIITAAGEAYLVDTRGQQAEQVGFDLEEDEVVKHLGLGSNFELVVTNTRVVVRGSSQLCPARDVPG